ncbi:MAG: hypothetical protein EGQ72_01395, partial [Anaeroglobus sp.]|nr:hypothetical protein [Anaeroglobus sp.]
ARPTEYPRQASRDGVATPDTQPNTTGKISITTLIRIRQEKIMFSFRKKKVLLPGHDVRKNLGHTSECGGRNTPFGRVSIGERKSDITHTSCISKFYPTFRV